MKPIICFIILLYVISCSEIKDYLDWQEYQERMQTIRDREDEMWCTIRDREKQRRYKRQYLARLRKSGQREFEEEILGWRKFVALAEEGKIPVYDWVLEIAHEVIANADYVAEFPDVSKNLF